jgi:hypothetical protein
MFRKAIPLMRHGLRLSTSESEGMGGGEESMLGRVEESIGVLERSPR